MGKICYYSFDYIEFSSNLYTLWLFGRFQYKLPYTLFECRRYSWLQIWPTSSFFCCVHLRYVAEISESRQNRWDGTGQCCTTGRIFGRI